MDRAGEGPSGRAGTWPEPNTLGPSPKETCRLAASHLPPTPRASPPSALHPTPLLVPNPAGCSPSGFSEARAAAQPSCSLSSDPSYGLPTTCQHIQAQTPGCGDHQGRPGCRNLPPGPRMACTFPGLSDHLPRAFCSEPSPQGPFPPSGLVGSIPCSGQPPHQPQAHWPQACLVQPLARRGGQRSNAK